MYSLELPSGKTLDMPTGLQFSFELQNSVFSRSDTSVLPGSFTFPVKLPATGTNLAAFNLPHLPTAANALHTIENVWVRAHSVRMFFGTLKIREAGGDIEVSITANPLKETRDITLPEIDLGGDRPFGPDDTARQATMLASATDPDSHDFVFCPVSAPFFFSENPAGLPLGEVSWQNRYSLASNSFPLNHGPLVPFPKIKYILRQLVETVSGWDFSNDWQLTNELSRLYFYSNADIHEADGTERAYPDTFNLTEHVPGISGNDFLKYLSEYFCLGVFTDIFDRSISLTPLRTVLEAAPVHDWTNYADGPPTVSYGDADPFLHFRHRPVGYNNRRTVRREYNGPVEDLPGFETEGAFDTAIAGGLATGFYYVEATELVYYLDQFQNRSIVKHQRGRVRFAGSPALEPKLQPLLTGHVSVAAGVDYYVPQWHQTGSYFRTGQLASDTEYLENRPDPAIFFYRGIQDGYPLGGVGTLSPDGTGTAEITANGTSEGGAGHSLLWPGEKGLYARNWQRWHDILRNGKPVTQRLTLPLTELVRFRFHQKVRILNMDYFVKSLRVKKLTTDRKFTVEANLFSVI